MANNNSQFYIGIPYNDTFTPLYVQETYRDEYTSYITFIGNITIYDDIYGEDIIETYKVYSVNDQSFYHSDLSDYVYDNCIFLHDSSSPENDLNISSLTPFSHYWEPVNIGYVTVNNTNSDILLFDHYQTSIPSNINTWTQTGTNSWQIYVNTKDAFYGISIPVSSGNRYTFNFTTDSEEGCDGIIFSTTSIAPGDGSISEESGDFVLSGVGESGSYTFDVTSNGYVYVYFMTDGGVLNGPNYDAYYERGAFSYSYSATPQPQPTTRTITLDHSYGQGGTSSITISVGASLSSYPTITHQVRGEHYRFLGYYSQQTSGGTCYYNALLNNGQGGWANIIPGTGDVTIYAHWLNSISDTSFYSNPTTTYSTSSQTLRIAGGSAYCPYGSITFDMDNDDGFGPYNGSYAYITIPAETSVGDYYLTINLYSQTLDGSSTMVIGDNYQETVKISITKISQSAPTVYGHTDTYGNTVYADVVHNNQYGTLYYQVDTSGGTNYGTDTTTRPSRSAVGTTTFRAYFTGDSIHDASPWSSQASLTITKAAQPMYINPTSMTLYSITSDGNNNPTGYTYNTGTITPYNNQGNVSYSSSNTSVATVDSYGNVTYKDAGSCIITVTAAGNGNYESGSCTCSVTCILDTLGSTRYSDTNGTVGYNTTYGKPTVSIGSGLWAGGGSAEVSCSVTNTLSWYQQYTTGWWSDLQIDTESGTARWRITSNGNDRFSSPSSGESTIYINGSGYYTYATGTNVSHGDMTTNETSDTVEITAYNVDDTSKHTSTSETITNSLENQKYEDTNGTTGYNMTYGIPEVEMGYGLSASGGDAKITCSVTDTKTYYKRYTSGSYTSLLSDSFNGDARWQISSNGNDRFYNSSNDSYSIVDGIGGYLYFSNQRVYHDSMGIDIATDTVTVTVYNVSDISKSTSVSQSIYNGVIELILVVLPTTVEYGGNAEANVTSTFTSGETLNVSSECEFSTDPSDIVNIS